MKTILSVIIVIVALTACGKAPMNGKLDGRWQLMTIDSHGKDSLVYPEFIYYDIALRVIQLKRTHGEEYETGGILGRFNHTDDSLYIRMIHTSKDNVRYFGINDTIQHFAVETLTKKKMILSSDYARLNFRKF